jgi:glycosyltransferase EpsE
MGAYNCEDTVEAAVQSIVQQSFREWELIICDDASTDRTPAVLKRLAHAHPDRIKVIRNPQNQRLSGALNRCLAEAKGEFIARMDADDLSHPARFSTQVTYLEAHPAVDMVGTAMMRFGDLGEGSKVAPPPSPDKFSLRASSPFCHATVLARREVFTDLCGYDESVRVQRVEDIDLWFRFFHKGFVGRNLSEPFYYVREDHHAVARRTVGNRWNLMLVMYRGYRLLDYPTSWYGLPVLLFLKALVPKRAQAWYRKRQGARTRVAGGTT